MSVPSFTLRQLLEAGIHFGHHPRRWNPKMSSYLYGIRNGVHIINLEKTVPLLHKALEVLQETVAQGGRILFVGTKMQASPIVAEAARKCGQYYVNHRWLGGMLTNWKTVSLSIKRLKELDELLENAENLTLTKKELLKVRLERDKLELILGGIREMGGLPDVVVILDVNKDHIAIEEANKLKIPVIGILDSNSDPAGITYPIPGNDDATRAITLYANLFSHAVLEGLQVEMLASGIDVGSQADIPEEAVLAEEALPEEKVVEVSEA